MNTKIRGITVTINGDTKGLGKALDAAKKQSIKLNEELKQVNKALKLNPSNVNLLSEKQKILADSVKAAREELNELEAAQGDVEKMYQSGDIDRGAYLEFQRKLEQARENLKRLQDQQVEFGSVAGQIMQQVGKKVEDFGGKVEGIGKKIMPISAATAAAGGAAVKMAWDFEDSMAKVSTIADTTEVPLDQLQAAILELSDQTGIAAGEIAENVYNAISAGQSTGDAVEFVAKATDLARAGFAESGNALDLLTTIMNAYKLEADEVTNVSDTLIATQNLGKTTVAELSASMGKIIPTAKAANVQLDQVSAGYALMTANGVATAESTTYMNSMLNELNKSGTKVSDTLKNQTGKSFSELMSEGYTLGDVLGIIDTAAAGDNKTLMDMFGSAEAAKAGLILLGNDVADVENGLVEAGGSAGDFNNMLANIRDGTGGTASALEKLDTNNQKVKVAFNQVKNAALDFGQTASGMLAPYIEKFAGFIQTATDKLKGMDDGQKKAIVTIAGVVAAAGPLLSIAGKGIQVVGGVIRTGGNIVNTFTGAAAALKGGASAFSLVGTGAKLAGVAITVLSSPITWIVAGVAALVAGFIALYKKCEWFRNGVNAVAAGVKNVWNTGMDALKTTASEKLATVKSAYEENGGGIKGVVAATMTGIKEIHTFGLDFIDNLTGGKLTEIKEKFLNSNVGQVWSTAMEGVKSAGRAGMEALQTTTAEKLSNIKAVYSENGGGIKGIVAATMTGIQETQTFGLDYLDTLTGGKLSSIAEQFRSKMEDAKLAVTTVLDNIKSAFSEKIEAARAAVDQGIENIKECFNFEWHLPHLALPHITITGEWGFNPPRYPSFGISWYKEGGILSGAQIFGAMGKRLLGGGEAGPEAVLPLRSFYDELSKILNDRLGGPGGGGTPAFYQYNTYNSPKDLSPAECARQTRVETQKVVEKLRKA